MQNAQPAQGSLLSARRWINILGEEGFVVIFVVWLLFLSFSTRAFATPDNIATVLRQAAVIAIIAIGEHFVVLLGTMDVSLPSILTIGGVFTGALMVNAHVPVLAVLGCVLVLGALLGLANGVIVTRLKINPIITTLGMMYILSGIAFVYTRGRTVYGDALAPIDFLARGRLLGIRLLSSSCSCCTSSSISFCATRVSAPGFSPRETIEGVVASPGSRPPG